MEDWFVPQISLYRFPNATFELRVHLHLSHSAYAGRLTADNIEITPHGDQLLVSGSVTPHVEGYYHGYPYSGETIRQGTVVWTDQPCGRFGRSVDLGLAPGTEYVVLDRRVECGDYIIQYTLRNKPNLATNSCVNIAACSHDPGAHVCGHPLYAEPNIVPCTPYPAETLGFNATHLPGVGVSGGTHAGIPGHVVNGVGVGFSAGYGQQETQTATAQGQAGCYTLAGAAGVGVGFGAGQTGSGQTAGGTAETALVKPGQTTTTSTAGVTTGHTTSATAQGEVVGVISGGLTLGGLVGTAQTTHASTSISNSTKIDGNIGVGVDVDVGVGAVGTLVGTSQTTQTTSTSNSTEIDGKFGIGTGIGFSGGAGIGSTGAGVGGSIGVGIGAGAVGALAGTAQTTQTSTSTSSSTEIDGKFGIGAGIGFSGSAGIGSIGAGVGGGVSVGAVMGTSTSVTLAEASSSLSSSGQCGGVSIGGGEWTLAPTQTRGPGQAMAAEGTIIRAGEDVQRGRGMLVSSSSVENAGSSTTQITESSTQQVSQTSASAEVDVEIGRGRKTRGTHVTFADQEETFAKYNGGRVSAQQGQVAWESSSTLVGTEQAAVRSSTQQTSESLTQQVTQTLSSSEVDVGIVTGKRSSGAGMHVTFADESSKQHGVAVSERTDVQSSLQTTQTTQASSEVDVGIGSVTGTRVAFAEKSSGQYGEVSEQTQVQGQDVDTLVLRGSENVRQESSMGVVERDSERIVTDMRTSMEEDVRTLTRGSVQSSTSTESSTQVTTTESSVTATSEASSTQQIQENLSQVQVDEASGSRQINQDRCSGTSNMEVGTSQAVALGSAQEYYQRSTQEISQSSTQEITQCESELESSSTTRDIAQAAALETVTSSSTEVLQTTTELEQQGILSSMEIVQSASELAQEGVSSSTEIVQSMQETVVQESISSSTEVAQTAIQESSTVVGSSSTADVAIFENDGCRGTQPSTGILVASARPNVQGSLKGKNVEATYESVEADSTASATTATLITGEDRGVSFESAAAVGQVDTTVVSELEGDIQTSLSTEIARTATTTSGSTATAQQTEQELLIDQTQKITEGISGEDLTQIQGNRNDNGSDHERSSVHSDSWHVVSGSMSSIKGVASSEQTLNVPSEQQFRSDSSEQHTDAVFSSQKTLAVSTEQCHASSQQTYTESSGEARVVLPEQHIPVSAELLHSIAAQYTAGSVRE